MQKRIYLLTLFSIGLVANAQSYTGKVGINTDTPSATLDIVSAGNDGTTKALEINNTASPSKEMVTVLNNNNVGLGNASPSYNLDIADYLSNGSNIGLGQTGTNNNGQTGLVLFSKRTGSNLITNSTSNGWKITNYSDTHTTTNARNSLIFDSYTNGVRQPDVIVMKPNGNIGFGMQNPSDHLQVPYGSMRIDNPDATDNGIKFSGTGGIYHRPFSTLSSGGGGNYLSVNSSSAGVALESESKNTYLFVNNTTGNIGINTPTPTNQFHVVATTNPVRFEGLQNGANTNEIVSVDANGVLYKNTLQNVVAGNFWGLTGNAGTTAGTNFLGTTDDQDLVFKRNNIVSGWINLNNTSTSFGTNTLNSSTNTGFDNAAFGAFTLSKNTSGESNTAIGSGSLSNNTTGMSNQGLGAYTLYNNTSGTDNTAVGNGALFNNTTGSNNIAVGYNALYDNTVGQKNIAIGLSALEVNSSGGNSVAIGANTLKQNTTGYSNIAIGGNTLTEGNGHDNTAVGTYAMKHQDGAFNVAVGAAAGSSASGNYNNTIFMGIYSGFSLQTGNDNIGIGTNSLRSITSGISNTALGHESGYALLNGDYNTFLGWHAGIPTSITSVNRSTAIGYNAIVAQDDSIVIGNADTATKIGIGTDSPKTRLHVKTGDVYVDDSTKGIILKSPNGSCYRVTVSDTGILTPASVTCP